MKLNILPQTQRLPTNATPNLYTITPSIAEELLKHNYESNRLRRDGIVRAYANDMKNGNWKAGTPDMIVIGNDGKLYNGQHRMAAVILSNTEQQFWVLENADPSLFATIDSGYKRNTVDYLSNLPHPRLMDTLSSILYALKYGTGSIGNCLSRRVARNTSVTRSNTIETANGYSDILENYIEMSYDIYTRTEKRFLNHIAIALMLMDQLNPHAKFNNFVAELKTLSPSSDIVTIMRNLMLRNADRIDRSDQKTYNIGIMITAYELYCNNKGCLCERSLLQEFKKYQHTLNDYNEKLMNYRRLTSIDN